MNIIEPSFEILNPPIQDTLLGQIELAARTCYKSDGTGKELGLLTSSLIQREHLAMLEFGDLTIRFIHNRGFLAELSRHRIISLAVESTRYCLYASSKFDNEITVIRPYYLAIQDEQSIKWEAWKAAMVQCEKSYMALVDSGCRAEDARGVLPNDLKTEIVMKTNIREMLHILKLRTAPNAHYDMRRVLVPLQEELQTKYPILF